jgi:hypothetical protein
MRSASRSRQFLCTVKQTVGKEGPVETVTDRLVEHVEELVHPIERPLVWGNPLLSTTPTPLAVHDLALRVEALEAAVREIARDLQRLLDDDCTR